MAAGKQKQIAFPHTGAYYWVEAAAIAAWVGLFGWGVWRVAPWALENPWWTAMIVPFGYVCADFLSGFVHWAGDTWGSYKTPVVGRALIAGFRDHHVDELGITRHDFVDTNGNNCLVALPAMVFLVVVPIPNGWIAGVCGLLLSTALWTMVTNQIHKWAHQPPELVPGYLKTLQRWNVILAPDHHRRHHAEPYLSHYCITVGWLNPILDGTGFFRGLERAISAVTGVVPRAANGEADEYGVYGEVIAPTAEQPAEAGAERHAANG